MADLDLDRTGHRRHARGRARPATSMPRSPRARAAWAGWAARPLAFRIETLRRFANVVRGKKERLRRPDRARDRQAALGGARPRSRRWSTRSTSRSRPIRSAPSQRRLEGALGARVAVRHKPHGVLAVLGPYNFPAHLPNGHIVPALLAGNAVVFKPSREDPGGRRVSGPALPRGRACPRTSSAASRAGRRSARRSPPIRGSTACCSPARPAPASPSTASSPTRRTRSSRSRWAATTRSSSGTRTDIHAAAAIAVQSAFMSAGQRCTAARRLIVQDGAHEELVDDDRQARRPADRRPSPRHARRRSWAR